MIFRKAAVMAAVLAIALTATPAFAWHHVLAPVVAPITKTGGVSIGGGGGASAAGLVAGFIGGILIVGIIHEINGPACASNTRWNIARGYNYPRFWRTICRRDPKPIRVRG